MKHLVKSFKHKFRMQKWWIKFKKQAQYRVSLNPQGPWRGKIVLLGFLLLQSRVQDHPTLQELKNNAKNSLSYDSRSVRNPITWQEEVLCPHAKCQNFQRSHLFKDEQDIAQKQLAGLNLRSRLSASRDQFLKVTARMKRQIVKLQPRIAKSQSKIDTIPTES